MTSWKSSITLRAPSIGSERKSSDYTEPAAIAFYLVQAPTKCLLLVNWSTEGRESDRPDQSCSLGADQEIEWSQGHRVVPSANSGLGQEVPPVPFRMHRKQV